MYSLIRVIIILFIFPVVLFALSKLFRIKYYSKKRNPEMYSKAKQEKRSRGKVFLWLLSSILVCVMISIPLSFPREGSFLTFDSYDAALSYMGVNPEQVVVHETDSTVFAIEKHKIYSITKRDERFGLPNYKCVLDSYYEPISSNSIIIGFPSGCHNEETGETLYLVTLSGESEFEKVTMNSVDAKFINKYTRPVEHLTFTHYQYVYETSGALYEEIELNTLGTRIYGATLVRR